MAPARILHTPTNVGNNAWHLSRAERELGLVSDVVDFTPAAFGYEADRRIDVTGTSLARRALTRSAFIARAAHDYDVFHFNFGQPLLALRARGHVLTELALLKRLGKTILVTWQGCDVRPQAECHCTRASCTAEDPWRAPTAAAMLRHADRGFYLNPDLGKHLPGASFMPYASVPVHRVAQRSAPAAREPVVIAHAPSNREVKGTAHVIAAVEALRADGINVELDLVEGLPNDEALQRFAAADVLVDQLHLGWYGGVAVEAMAMGVPVVCAIDDQLNPFGARLPIVRADPSSVESVLRGLVADRSRLPQIGAASRAFALAEHDPRVIARRCYEGLIELP